MAGESKKVCVRAGGGGEQAEGESFGGKDPSDMLSQAKNPYVSRQIEPALRLHPPLSFLLEVLLLQP